MKAHFALLPLVAALTACGGSDSSAPTNPTQPIKLASNISGELQSINGTMLKINGQTIDAANAKVDFGNNAKTTELSMLQPGMMLTVKTADNAATNIVYDELLQAQVTAISPTTKTLTMAGMKVLTKGARLEHGLVLDQSLVDNKAILEVSGFAVDGNTIQATYIEREDDADAQTEIEGMVSNLNGTQFTLGKITVDYTNANFEPRRPQNGDWVEIEGQINGLKLTASKVEIDAPNFDDDASLEAEGRVSWISPAFDHMVINQNRAVTLTTTTRYEGISAAKIKPGMLLEVEGNWDSNSMTLVATEVELDNDHDGDAHIPVNSREFELEGYAKYHQSQNTVTINGIAFLVTPHTELEDNLSLNNLNGNAWVSLSGYEQNGQQLAMEIEEESPEATIELEGVVKTVGQQYSLWGYPATDESLTQFADGKSHELECVLGTDPSIKGKNNVISSCRVETDD